MTVKLKDLKVLPPDHPIYNGGFKTYPVNSSKNKKLHPTEALKKNGVEVKDIYKVNSLEDYKKQREKKEGLKNLFLEKLDHKKSDEEMTQQLISILKKNGWNIKK